MVGQVAAVSLVLLSVRWSSLTLAADICLWAVMIFGLVSAVDYFMKFWRKVDDEVKKRRRLELLAREQADRHTTVSPQR